MPLFVSSDAAARAMLILVILASASAQFTACMYGNIGNSQRCGVCFEGGCPGDCTCSHQFFLLSCEANCCNELKFSTCSHLPSLACYAISNPTDFGPLHSCSGAFSAQRSIVECSARTGSVSKTYYFHFSHIHMLLIFYRGRCPRGVRGVLCRKRGHRLSNARAVLCASHCRGHAIRRVHLLSTQLAQSNSFMTARVVIFAF